MQPMDAMKEARLVIGRKGQVLNLYDQEQRF